MRILCVCVYPQCVGETILLLGASVTVKEPEHLACLFTPPPHRSVTTWV